MGVSVSSMKHDNVGIPNETTAGPAVTLLTIYVAVLWGVPSSQTIGVLGSLGAPSTLWGLVCLAYWAFDLLRRPASPACARLRPVRMAYFIFMVVVWLSFSFAQMRGLPSDETSPSTSALIRTLSWAGVLLLAHDALTSTAQLRILARRFALFGGLFALLGLAQFFTGQAFIDRIHVPGLVVNAELLGMQGRSGFVRASATAMHPLEYAVVLASVFPISVALAMTSPGRGLLRCWWIPAVTAVSCLLSVSRSAIIGFVVGLTLLLPSLSWRGRRWILCGLGAAVVFVYLAVPGMLGSLTGLFVSQDASTQSRSNGLAVAAQVAAHNPIIGRGFGTFLPKYYILDNELALLLIEVGVLGLLAFLAIGVAAIVQSQRARRLAQDPDFALLAQALTAGFAAGLVLFAFFDAFSFGMAAGTVMLLAGLCGSAYNLALTDAAVNLSTEARRI